MGRLDKQASWPCSTAGTSAIYATSPLDQALRDQMTIAAHAIASPATSDQPVGFSWAFPPTPSSSKSRSAAGSSGGMDLRD